MKNNTLIVIIIVLTLFFSGCIIEYREGLPAKIVIAEMPEEQPEEMLCEHPPCATLVQMSEVKRTEYICSPLSKGANDDPRGTVYKTQLGDTCTPLTHPTTSCLKYNCEFDKEQGIGFYRIYVEFSKKNQGSNVSLGVAPINEILPSDLLKKYEKGSLGIYKLNDIDYEFKENYLSGYAIEDYDGSLYITGGSYTKSPIGYYYKSEFHKNNSKLQAFEQRNCLASMPLIYPYNSIDFAYNPIVNSSKNPTEVLMDLQTDYKYLSDLAEQFTSETSKRVDPCEEICSKADLDFVEGGEPDTSLQDECNTCQDNEKEKAKEDMKKQKENNAGAGGYLLGDFNEGGLISCTGLTPCVEIDRAIAYGTDDDKGKNETKYFICQCSCETVVYSNYVCERAGDTTQYFYTSCEVNNIVSDQGGYIYTIHGFEAEVFKNILGYSENKMPTFMVGQGPTFDEYVEAKEKCVPNITADEIIVAGNEPFTPHTIEVLSGSPVCFRNDGTYNRKLFVGDSKSYLTNLSTSEGKCFETGPDTNFTIGSNSVYVDDNKVHAIVEVTDPTTKTEIKNTLRKNDNNELKFYFNDEDELSLLYASSPVLSEITTLQGLKYSSRDYGEFILFDSYTLEHVGFFEGTYPLTWIAYSTQDSMKLFRHDFYSDKYDSNNDNRLDLQDFYNLSKKTGSEAQLFTDLLNDYRYFFNVAFLKTGYDMKDDYFDYPTITKNSNYYEFSPGAIILPVKSKFCIHNTFNDIVDLMLERKTKEIYPREIASSTLLDPTSLTLMNYKDGNLPNTFYIEGNEYIQLDPALNNYNYEFVEGKSLYPGLECCFDLNEPGIYRVSSLKGETGNGYVVVLPSGVGNTIVLNDYEYSPKIAIPKKGDFVCISNPYSFDRDISLSGSFNEMIKLKANTETCSYKWAESVGNNVIFEDIMTGGIFKLNSTQSDVLNIDVIASMFVQKTGKIENDGTVCFINNDDFKSKITITGLSRNLVSTFDLEAQEIKCFPEAPFNVDGLYKLNISQISDNLIEPRSSDLYIAIAPDNKGYIYNSTFYTNSVIFKLDELDNLFGEIGPRKNKEVKISSFDNVDYYLYTHIPFDNYMGFRTSNHYIQSPEIIFENLGNSTLTLKIFNYKLPEKTLTIRPKQYHYYLYREGDYQMNISGNFYGFEKVPTSSPRKKSLLDSSRILIKNEDSYFSDGFKTYDSYGEIKFKNNLFFNVSSSLTQSVNYGTLVSSKEQSFKENPIKGKFTIDSVVSEKSILDMQVLSGSYNNLDFAVQILSGIPSDDILTKAKYILAYDKSLPVFMYSRIGYVQIDLDNPSKKETYEIPKGSEVAFVKSDWLSEFIPGFYIPKNAIVTSTDSSITYGIQNYHTLDSDVNFTIKTILTGVEKIVEVKAVEPSRTIVMDYTEFEVVDDGKTGDKKYIINNMAYEPRAFTLRPEKANSYCIEFNGKVSPKTISLTSQSNKTASKMKLYSLEGDDSLNTIDYHDPYYKKVKEVSDITILPNYGINVSGISLERLEAGEGEDTYEVGYLYLKPTFTKMSDANVDDETVAFMEGYISGLSKTSYVRAYRFYGSNDKLELTVNSKVYGDNFYSILARVFTSEENPTNKLLGTANLYLRLKNAKAVHNRWYMAGLSTTTFENLVRGFDTYLDETSLEKRTIVGDYNRWVNSGCGDYVFVVPFNYTHTPQAFAYDVPVLLTNENRESLTYMRTSNLNYKYAIQKVSSNVKFKIVNGEIINDVKILLSENPNEASEICGYFDVSKNFQVTPDLGTYYGEKKTDFYFEASDGDCGWLEEDDFELSVYSNALKSYYPNNPLMVYTPTGRACGWGGGDGIIGTDPICDGTNGGINGEDCRGSHGFCVKNSNCLENIIGKRDDLYSLYQLREGACNTAYQDCFETCTLGSISCRTLCLRVPACITLIGVETNFDICYNALVEIDKKNCDESFEDEPDCLSITYNRLLEYDSGGFCKKESVGEPLNSHLKKYGTAFLNCLNSSALAKDDKCVDGMSFESIDTTVDYKTWWCRNNIDVFGYETGMVKKGDDSWYFMPVSKLPPNQKLVIKNNFDKGISFNDDLYHLMSDGYFDIFSINDGTHENTEGKNNICVDRGKGADALFNFYTDMNLKNDYGFSESAMTFGLFFILNSVDTGDYFFSSESESGLVERSKGYVLDSVFPVENNAGRKVLCVGADSFNGINYVLAPGAKEDVNLDLKTSYNVYEPAYFTNFVLDGDRTFSHISLFTRSDINDYTLGNFNYAKPLTSVGGFIQTQPDYNSVVNINLYNLITSLETSNGLESFEVINLIEGESVTLKNVGDSEIVWFFGDDDICEKGFTTLLNERYQAKCSLEGYIPCIEYPEGYSVNPSDISKYLENNGIKKIIVSPESELEIDSNDLKVLPDSNSTEYLFFNPETGKRFTVIVSKEPFVITLDINSFSQDKVSVFNNKKSKLCVNNIDFTDRDILLVSKSNPSNIITRSIQSWGNICFDKSEIENYDIIDSTLKRKLNVVLLDFNSNDGNNEISSIIANITKKVVRRTIDSYNPAYGFLELNLGASATPAIITTEIIDYRDIVNTNNNPSANDDMVNAIADQVYAIVSNSRIVSNKICPDSDNEIDTLPNGTLCTILEDEVEQKTNTDELSSKILDVDCDERYAGSSPEQVEARTKCNEIVDSMKEKYAELKEEMTPFTIINEDKVIAMMPIMIHFDSSKNNLTKTEVDNIKRLIDRVNLRVNYLCRGGECDNSVINTGCGTGSFDAIEIQNRYLDMIGFIVLIDDPGVSNRGNCSFMYNYLKGVMDISIYSASTLNDSSGVVTKLGMPSMILGFGVNRKANAVDSCWNDLEFKKEIEALYNTDFTILLDKGIIGVGHYCLRDGKCLPISTGATNGEDYGLYMPVNEEVGWPGIIPIEVPPITELEYGQLSTSEKKDCIKVGGVYYCDPIIDASKITTQQTGPSLTGSLLNNINLGNVDTGFGMSSILNTGLNPSVSNNLGNILGSPFSGIKLNPGIELGEIPPLLVLPGLLNGGLKKEPYGKEWFDRCGRYYYKGEGMTLVVYPEKDILPGQQGKSCNPGRMLEIYKKFNC